MPHGPETEALTARSIAVLSGQDWASDNLSDSDREAVEMTVMFLVALAAQNDPGFVAAVEAHRRPMTKEDLATVFAPLPAAEAAALKDHLP